MSRYALLVHYDGTNFNGWQIQDGGRTVQDEIEKAIKIYTKESIRVTASGRTDAGVHALGQVIHFDFNGDLDLRRFCTGLNGIMPGDVSVVNGYAADDDFHSRFSAVRREYLYKIYSCPLRSPFIRQRAMWVKHDLDADYIRKVTSLLVGENDFASFCKKISSDKGTVRKIESIEVREEGNIITLRISGNAFLHNMIRIIVGTVVQMYREKKEPGYIRYILDQKDREFSGFTAPSCGLYLNRVTYSPPLDSYDSAF